MTTTEILEKEWIEKYDLETGQCKEPLSQECYQFIRQHPNTNEILKKYGLDYFEDIFTTCNDEQSKFNLAKVKLRECYEWIIEIHKSYMDLPPQAMKLISVWLIGTYFHEEFPTYAYLYLNAMRGSGKTRELKIISSLGHKGDGSVQNNLTEAVLFRIPRNTTTCIDEVEQIGSKDKQTLRELLNSAYKKGMKVKRMKKMKVQGQEQQVTETFQPYFPIALANIWGMDEVLGDRSIPIILEKSGNPGVTKKVEDFDTNPNFNRIKRTLEQISVVCVVSLRKKNIIKNWNNYIDLKYNNINNITTITTHNNITTQEREFYDKIDRSGIHGRNFELAFPLLLIAKEIGEDVFEDILNIMSEIVLTKRKDEITESKDASLYEFVAKADDLRFKYIPMKELTSRFRIYLGESDNDDKWLNEKWMGRALKRLQIIADKKREASGRLALLNIDKAKEKLRILGTEDG